MYFVVPLEGNENAFGFDLASNPTRLQALTKARDTGRQVATAPITLVQETERQASILVIAPVYSKNSSIDSREDRQTNLRGFLTGAFRVGDIISTAQPSIEHADFSLKIVDSKAHVDEQLLFDRSRGT